MIWGFKKQERGKRKWNGMLYYSGFSLENRNDSILSKRWIQYRQLGAFTTIRRTGGIEGQGRPLLDFSFTSSFQLSAKFSVSKLQELHKPAARS